MFHILIGYNLRLSQHSLMFWINLHIPIYPIISLSHHYDSWDSCAINYDMIIPHHPVYDLIILSLIVVSLWQWLMWSGVSLFHHCGISHMEVSINGGSPIAGWFISWKTPNKNGKRTGCTHVYPHFRKPPYQ